MATTRKKVVSVKKNATPRSMPKAGKNPKGGLTEAGREYFTKKQGSHLKPGVTGAADTPEKMRRKGSFLVRTFTHPRGPMLDDKGEPTRLALSAHAWGEPVPRTETAAKKLAAKGRKLLQQYHAKTDTKPAKKAAKKTAAKKPVAKKAAAKKVVAKRTASKNKA